MENRINVKIQIVKKNKIIINGQNYAIENMNSKEKTSECYAFFAIENMIPN
jgi:hypothetical protein